MQLIDLYNTMILFKTPDQTQKMLADHVRSRRLAQELTQEGLAKRSGVPLPSLRKFEQTGMISLGSFLKLLMVVGGLEEVVQAVAPRNMPFASIDDVLKADDKPSRKRGRRS